MGDTGYVAAMMTHKRGAEDTAKESELFGVVVFFACTGGSSVAFFRRMCKFCACWLTFQSNA